MVFDFVGVVIAAVVQGGLLGVDEGDASERLLVGEVRLVLFGPEIDLFDAVEPALVVEGGGEFAEPGTHAVGDGVEDPDADFGVAADAVFPAIGLFEADAEEADDGLVAHGGAIFFGGFAHEPGRLETAARLAVGDEHGSALADRDGVERIVCAASVVGDGAGFGIDCADLCVPEIDKADETLRTPLDVGSRVMDLADWSCGEDRGRWRL